MEQKIRYTLGKEERLKSTKLIDQLFKEGKSFSIFPFRVLYLINKNGSDTTDPIHPKNHPLKTGFTVSSRHFKKAVDRNRIKRLMRECYRLQKNELENLHLLNNNTLNIFLIYVGKQIPEYEVMFAKTADILNRLIKNTSEKK